MGKPRDWTSRVNPGEATGRMEPAVRRAAGEYLRHWRPQRMNLRIFLSWEKDVVEYEDGDFVEEGAEGNQYIHVRYSNP